LLEHKGRLPFHINPHHNVRHTASQRIHLHLSAWRHAAYLSQVLGGILGRDLAHRRAPQAIMLK
jgi:hypothetical protein